MFKNIYSKYFYESEIKKALMPFYLVLVTVFVVLAVFAVKIVDNSTKKNTISESLGFIEQIKTVRSYYNTAVISKIKKSGEFLVTHDHTSASNKVPIPATFIHDVTKLFKKEDFSINMISPFRWDHRKEVMDDFQTKAWQLFQKDPEQVLSEQVTINGQTFMRVAVADRLTSEACVSCHNNDPKSPKKDWKLNDVRGVFEVKKSIQGQLDNAYSLTFLISIAFILILIVAFGFGLILAKRVYKPISAIGLSLEKIANGEIVNEIPGSNRNGRIGKIASSVYLFQKQMQERHKLEEEKLTNAEFAHSVSAKTMDFIENIETLRKVLLEAAANSDSTAKLLEAEVYATKTSAGDFNQLSIEAVKEANRVASASQTLEMSSQQISVYTAQSVEIGISISKQTRSAAEKIEQLNNAAHMISHVVELIKGLAERTNLLALNATIEAARAGEFGRGFSVVAAEVKALASQTANATLEITNHIAGIQSISTNASLSIANVSNVVAEIINALNGIEDAVAKQHQEIRGIRESITASTEANSIVQSTAKSVEASTEKAGLLTCNMAEEANQVTAYVEELNSKFNFFVDDIKQSAA